MFSKQSKHLENAIKQIKDAKSLPLTLEEREQKAVELAAEMLQEAIKTETFFEKKKQKQLARMMKDPIGKGFTTSMTDQCFRSKSSYRIANQLNYLLNLLGIPHYLNFLNRLQLKLFTLLTPFLSPILVPIMTFMLRKETSTVILPGEERSLNKHMQIRKDQGVRINLNHLGEAILGEKEALRKLNVYLEDLAKPQIEYISIKISTIFSQIHLLGWDHSLEVLSKRLRQLYRAAMTNSFTKANGEKTSKFVNLDMEEYRDLHLTKELFKKVLNEPEFLHFSAGIVLQAYLPDCFLIQEELTKWAKERINKGGAPIKIRIVKGANLAMEQFEASLKGWEQAPYQSKTDVDANYKKMVSYGCQKENAEAVHLGIGSHNLFDIAYAMLLRAENSVEPYVSFEMLEGMADHMRRVVQILTKDILLYCPVAEKKDFQSAIAYLIRRLDENTGPENFLRYTFGLKIKSPHWKEQAEKFKEACNTMNSIFIGPRRTQNRQNKPLPHKTSDLFKNEPDTDFSLRQNRHWAENFVKEWKQKTFPLVPCVIGGKEVSLPSKAEGIDPSYPSKVLYSYCLASWEEINQALMAAKEEESFWQNTSVEARANLLAKAAEKLQENRGNLIGVMMTDGGKTILEADAEVSEAIDFAQYYLRSLRKNHSYTDIKWQAKGTILVTPPWNFPIAIPAGGILAALATGNCVIFKPAPEAVLSGWILVNALWDAGISKKVLQFVNCVDTPVGSKLIADKRVNAVILTGATSTAKLFMELNNSLDLSAETGGKNAFIITALSDRDLAIKDLIQSAFGHAGQKCSAASLAILEAEVYDDPHFQEQLKDAVESLQVGSPWALESKVTPLIKAPEGDLLKALTTLEPGESWLVEPKKDPSNPNLWSPGVKWGVKEGSFMHQTEFFGPILAVLRADTLESAIRIANGTCYGLTSGINSLDMRDLKKWIDSIEAGNLYINRGTTGAIVGRQPFGGCKASSFGFGMKAGGPNYLMQFTHALQIGLPNEKISLPPTLTPITDLLGKIPFSTEEMGTLYGSLASYAFYIKKFPTSYDPSNPEGNLECLLDLTVGQDNALYYKPRNHMSFYIQKETNPLDILRIFAAALLTKTPLEVSWDPKDSPINFDETWTSLLHEFSFIQESEEELASRILNKKITRVRVLQEPGSNLKKAAAAAGCFLDTAPVLANGRFELLHYFREVSLSYDYHRYGNLGLREQEKRNPIL